MAGPCAARAGQAHLAIASREAPVEAPLPSVTFGEPFVFRALHRISFGVICCLRSIHARIVAQEFPSLVYPCGERDLLVHILAGLQEDNATPAWCSSGKRSQPAQRCEGGGERDRYSEQHRGWQSWVAVAVGQELDEQTPNLKSRFCNNNTRKTRCNVVHTKPNP